MGAQGIGVLLCFREKVASLFTVRNDMELEREPSHLDRFAHQQRIGQVVLSQQESQSLLGGPALWGAGG